jgi:hypothetical protein
MPSEKIHHDNRVHSTYISLDGITILNGSILLRITITHTLANMKSEYLETKSCKYFVHEDNNTGLCYRKTYIINDGLGLLIQ